MLEPEAITTIVRLGQSGWGAKRIARALGIARNTVRRYLNAGGPVPYRQPQRDSVLGGHVNGGRFPHKSGVHRRHGTA